MVIGVENTIGIETLSILKPILAFLVIFIIIFLILIKSKILGEQNFVLMVLAFVVASIFGLSVSVREVVLSAVPWIGVLLVILFFILIFASFIGKGNVVGSGLGWAFVILITLIFLITGFKIFVDDPFVYELIGLLYTYNLISTGIFILFAGLTTWVLVKFGGK